MALPGADPIAALGGQKFSFYPAIRNVEHNEWTLADSTWSEIQVANSGSGQNVWIPRSAIGEVSSAGQPRLILGLKRELEYKAGSIVPFRSKIVSIPERREPPSPEAVTETAPSQRPQGTQESQDHRVGRMISWALAFAGALSLLLVAFAVSGGRMPFASFFQADVSTTDQLYVGMTAETNFDGVVRRLGGPEEVQWITPADAPVQLQLAAYPTRRYGVILMGGGREGARYAGTIHLPTKKLLDSVPLSGGRSTSALLRNLPDF